MPTAFQRFDWDTLPESVRDFLAEVAGGAVIERGGSVFASVIRADPPDGGEWTAGKNRRRCELIGRDLAGTITPDEQRELGGLTDAMREYVNRVAPLPTDGVAHLLGELRALAAARAVTPFFARPRRGELSDPA